MFNATGTFEAGLNAARRLWRNPFWLFAGAGGLVFIVGVVCLAGWALRVPALVRGQPGIDTIPPSGALGFLLLGAGLAAAALGGTRWAILCGGSAATLGAVNLTGHVLGVSPVLDSLLFPLLGIETLPAPGGMPPGGAIAFLMAGAGVASAVSPLPVRWRFLVLGTVGAAVAFTGVLARVGYIDQASGLWDIGFVPGMPALAALSFLLVGGGIAGFGIVGTNALPSPAKAPASGPLKSPLLFKPAGFVLPLLGTGLLLGSIGVFLIVLRQNWQADQAVRHTLNVIIALSRIEKSSVDKETGLRGYIITAQERFLEPYDAGEKDFAEAYGETQRLTADNPAQRRHLDTLRSLSTRWNEYAVKLIAARKAPGGASRTQEMFMSHLGKTLMDDMRAELAAMKRLEIQLLEKRSIRESAARTGLTVALLLCVGGGIFAGMTQFQIARRLDSQRQILASEVATRKAAEENLKRANQAYEAVNKELEAFAYSVSHDLRAPIRAMVGFSRMLIEDFGPQLPQEAQNHLSVIQAEGKRMGQLIDDLLAFSRVGRQELKATNCDLTALAQTVFESLDQQARSRVKQFDLKPLPPAYGDRALLRQVLFNLLANAVKFTGKHPAPAIEVGGSTEGGVNTYYVKDNGAGFDPRHAQKLFGVFQRLHSDEEFEGTGVGLALVKRIIQRHGGEVRAEGKPNEGATFIFTLPTSKGA